MENNHLIFLSIPCTEKGLAQRKAFLDEAADKKEHEKWNFEFVPSDAEVTGLLESDSAMFERKIADCINQSFMSVQLISSDVEFDDDKGKRQHELIERHRQSSPSFRNIYWQLNTESSEILKSLSITDIRNNKDAIFEAINTFWENRTIANNNIPRYEIAFLYEYYGDHNNASRIEVKKTFEDLRESVRYCGEDTPSKQKLTDIIKESVITFIFYGSAKKDWFKVQEEIVLWDVPGPQRKVIYIDEPEKQAKLDSDVTQLQYDLIIMGDIGVIRSPAFQNLKKQK